VAQQNLLHRGFKTNAEKTALEYRKKLNLLPHDPLCGFKLAEHLEIPVHTACEIFPEGTNLDDLLEKDKGWSALTMKTKVRTIIIHNHLHPNVRQQSNLMHELAHILCQHKHPELQENINLPFFMRKFDKQQEDEANCLGSTLQITRDGLVWALKERMTNDQIAEYFNASAAMVTLRLNMTGVKKQLKYLQ
jgi:Zn-dependent peptidase ImmA (M78 family)